MIIDTGAGAVGAGGFEIAAAAPADASAIAQVHARAWRETYAGVLPDDLLAAVSAETRLPQRRRILEGDEVLSFKLSRRGEVVGFADAGPYRDEIAAGHGEIYAIYLLDEIKRRHWGTALLARALEGLAGQGVSELSVWVLEGNAGARSFYERLDGREAGAKATLRGDASFGEIRYHWPSLDALRAKLAGRRQSL